jgi:hypothetical protein
MERWNNKLPYECIENVKVDEFIEDIIKVCRKHKHCIYHQDMHGAVKVWNIDKNEKRNL